MKQFTIYVPIIDVFFHVVEESELDAREFLFYSDVLKINGYPEMHCVEIFDIKCSVRSISQLLRSESKITLYEKIYILCNHNDESSYK
jgi:hypothetical protein